MQLRENTNIPTDNVEVAKLQGRHVENFAPTSRWISLLLAVIQVTRPEESSSCGTRVIESFAGRVNCSKLLKAIFM